MRANSNSSHVPGLHPLQAIDDIFGLLSLLSDQIKEAEGKNTEFRIQIPKAQDAVTRFAIDLTNSFLPNAQVHRGTVVPSSPGLVIKEVPFGLVWCISHRRFLDALFLLRAELNLLYSFFELSENTLGLLPSMWRSSIGYMNTCLMWPSDQFYKFAKYHTIAPIAFFLDQDMPANPSAEYFPDSRSFLIWSGPVRRYLRNLLVSRKSSKAMWLWWSYFQGIKRGTKVVDPNFTIENLVDHATILSKTPDPISQELKLRIDVLMDSMFNYIDSDKKFSYLDHGYLSTPYEPSTAASSESMRSMGGQRHIIRSLLQEQQFPLAGWSGMSDEPLFKMVETRHGVKSIHSSAPSLLNKSALELLISDKIQSEFAGSEADYKSALAFTKVSPILEPFKVRIITKSEALEQATSKSLQRGYSRTLWSIPAFILTSRPLDGADFIELLIQEDLVPVGYGNGLTESLYHHFQRTGAFWVSGDYKAATDGANLNCTKQINENIMSRSQLSKYSTMAARKILYEQDISYPKRFSPEIAKRLEKLGVEHRVNMDDTVSITQKNGQLMGSILSFPILCIMNLLAYWESLNSYISEVQGRQCIVPVELLPVRINGDDISFRANSHLYATWREKIVPYGFKLSLGKNYTHNQYVTINSKMFSIKTGETPLSTSVREVKYLNIGLLLGTDGTVKSQQKQDKPMYENYNTLIEGSIVPAYTHGRYLSYHKDQIYRATGNGYLNLFLPLGLCGVGFVNPAIVPSLTVAQRKLVDHRRTLVEKLSETSHIPNRDPGLRELKRQVNFVSNVPKPTYPDVSRTTTSALVFPNQVLLDTFPKEEESAPLLFEPIARNSDELEYKVELPDLRRLRRQVRDLPLISQSEKYKPDGLDFFKIRVSNRRSGPAAKEVLPVFRVPSAFAEYFEDKDDSDSGTL